MSLLVRDFEDSVERKKVTTTVLDRGALSTVAGIIGRSLSEAVSDAHSMIGSAAGSDHSELRSLFIQHSLYAIALIVLMSPSVWAEETIEQTIGVWNNWFGTFTQQSVHHYRCDMQRRASKPGVTLNDVVIPELERYGFEIFRRGNAS
jgi:hypothetical protein